MKVRLSKPGLNEEVEIFALSFPVICSSLQSKVDINKFPQLETLELADDFNDGNDSIDILIGSDHYWNIVHGETIRHIIHGRPPYSLPAILSCKYPIIMLTNERMLYSHQQQEQCVHWLALLWDIWMTIWLEDYMVAYHELSPNDSMRIWPYCC